MIRVTQAGGYALLASLVLVAALPTAASPLDDLHYLVGTWKCTYRAGAVRLPYVATYVYDRDGTLRQTDAFAAGGDEELLGYSPQRGGWTAVVFDRQGNATILRASGKDPQHIAYHSAYPDASIAVTFDRVSATQYTLHGTVHDAGKTTTNVDTCVRDTR